jgi:hypothetical protein
VILTKVNRSQWITVEDIGPANRINPSVLTTNLLKKLLKAVAALELSRAIFRSIFVHRISTLCYNYA